MEVVLKQVEERHDDGAGCEGVEGKEKHNIFAFILMNMGWGRYRREEALRIYCKPCISGTGYVLSGISHLVLKLSKSGQQNIC